MNAHIATLIGNTCMNPMNDKSRDNKRGGELPGRVAHARRRLHPAGCWCSSAVRVSLVLWGCLFFPLLANVEAAHAPLEAANAQLAVVLGAEPTPAETRVVELLAGRLKDRSGVFMAGSSEKAGLRVVIGTVASNNAIKMFADGREDVAGLGPDGYCIEADPVKRAIHVAGQSDSGVVAGVGRLMREMRYLPGRVEVPALRIAESPQMPNRGMYLWARKYYFNEPDKVDRYIEEFALWGGNAIALWFERGMFESFQDTTGEKSELSTGYARTYKFDKSLAQDWVAMYRRFYATARRMGMKTGLLMTANDAYMSSPKEMRVEPIIGCPDWYLCPAKPGAVEAMLGMHEEVFTALAPIDIFNIFPADPGGCSCADCTPWPTRGFWKIAKPLGDRIHAISPQTEIWVDTWHLNHPTFGGKDWEHLVADLDASKQAPAWFAGFEVGLAPHHRFVAMQPADRQLYNKSRRPLMVFPEISMYRNHPGMLVKKAYWKQLRDELNSYDPALMKGGWPYAERWNTDIACVMFLSWFWDPARPVDAILDEYAATYFGPAAENGRKLLELLDDGNADPERKRNIQATLATLESTAPEWVTRDWRWQEIVTACATKSR